MDYLRQRDGVAGMGHVQLDAPEGQGVLYKDGQVLHVIVRDVDVLQPALLAC